MFWSYVSYFLNFGANIIVLPAVLKFLSDAELGLWYVFITVSTMIQLLDFGFSPSIQRNVTYVWRGAPRLCREGFSDIRSDFATYSPLLMHKIVLVSNRIYLTLCSAMLLLMLSVGSGYVIYVARGMRWQEYLPAWIVYACGNVGCIYWGRWVTYLGAVGQVAASQKVIIAIKSLYILLAMLGLWAGWGLMAVASAFVISTLLPRVFAQWLFQRIAFPGGRPRIRLHRRELSLFWHILWFNAKRHGIAALAGIIAAHSLMLICSWFFGLEECAKYGLSLQLLTVAASTGSVIFTAYFPAFNAARVSGEHERLRDMFSLTMTVAWGIMLAGSTVIVLGGRWCLDIFGIGKQLLPRWTLILLALNIILERNMSLCCGMITTGNRIPFAGATLAAAGVSVVALLGLAMAGCRDFMWMIATVLLVQGAYNYWRWPYEVCRELGLNPLSILRRGCSYILRLNYGRP